jgi:hypothetical protein
MSTNLIINGVTYPFPAVGERPWAQKIINWATAVTAGMLQKAGGTFTLTQDVDFGATFGLKSAYFKSRSANPADTGLIRLSLNDVIAWRNNAGTGNNGMQLDALDNILWNGSRIATHAVVTPTEFGYLAGCLSSVQNQLNGKIDNPMTSSGDMIYLSGASPARIPLGNEGDILKIVSGIPTWVAP